MVNGTRDSAKIEEAKRLAAGPHRELAKFPLLFSKAAFFGEPPSREVSSRVNNGTLTLIDLGNGPMAITCSHVLTAYRELRERSERALFQIGSVAIDPLSQLIAEDTRLDLATIWLSASQVKTITQEDEIGSCVFQPSSWPPIPVNEGSFIAFGGFPGRWRERIAFDELGFRSFSSGASMVSSVGQDRFACQFEREYWVVSSNFEPALDLHDLGGMSGGPAFIHRGLYWEFVGIIYEFSPAYDIMFFRPAHLIRPDGTIDPSAV